MSNVFNGANSVDPWETMDSLVFTGESSFQEFVGGAGFRSSTVCFSQTEPFGVDVIGLGHVGRTKTQPRKVNAAQQGRRRTYRAHGRIGPYMCPAFMLLWLLLLLLLLVG